MCRHAIRRAGGLLVGLAVMLIAGPACALETERLSIVVNVTEERVQSESEYDFSASLEGVWGEDQQDARWELTVSSDYDRSLTAEEEYDLLKTWVRYLIRQRPREKWNPLIAISTEGDHDFDKVNTLVAAGFRKYFGEGFVEITGGASKDIQTGDDWVGDIGALVRLEKDFGRLTWTVNPSVNYGLLGEVRFRENRTIYTFSSGLNYELSKDMGIAYRLRLNNSQGDDRRHQFLGVSYRYEP